MVFEFTPLLSVQCCRCYRSLSVSFVYFLEFQLCAFWSVYFATADAIQIKILHVKFSVALLRPTFLRLSRRVQYHIFSNLCFTLTFIFVWTNFLGSWWPASVIRNQGHDSSSFNFPLLTKKKNPSKLLRKATRNEACFATLWKSPGSRRKATGPIVCKASKWLRIWLGLLHPQLTFPWSPQSTYKNVLTSS